MSHRDASMIVKKTDGMTVHQTLRGWRVWVTDPTGYRIASTALTVAERTSTGRVAVIDQLLDAAWLAQSSTP